MRRAILLFCSAAALSMAAVPPALAQNKREVDMVVVSDDRQAPRPSLAELRAAYRAAEKRLAEAATTTHAKWREAEGAPELRAPLREAVAELFDARQRLQARELEELRSRVDRLDTLLGDRANRRDLLIDARTDELLEHGLPAGAQDEQKLSQTPKAAKGDRYFANFDRQTQERLLKLDLQEALAARDAAEKTFVRLKSLQNAKAIEDSVVDEQEAKLTAARYRIDRLRAQLEALGTEPASEAQDSGAAGKAQDDQNDDEARARNAEELKLRIEEYERNVKHALDVKDRVQESIDLAQQRLRAVADEGTRAALTESVERANEDLDRVLKGLKETQALLAGARVELKRLQGSFPFGHAIETSRPETAAEADPDLQRQLLELDVEEANAAVAAAEDALKVTTALYEQGTTGYDAVRDRDAAVTRARFQVKRAKAKLNAFLRRDSAERRVEDDPELQRHVLEVELEEAKAALAGAEQQLEYATKMHKSGFLTDLEVRSRESALPRARLELKKAQAKLAAFLRTHPDQAAGSQAKGEGEVAKPVEAKQP